LARILHLPGLAGSKLQKHGNVKMNTATVARTK